MAKTSTAHVEHGERHVVRSGEILRTVTNAKVHTTAIVVPTTAARSSRISNRRSAPGLTVVRKLNV